jgi:hypothetical protein
MFAVTVEWERPNGPAGSVCTTTNHPTVGSAMSLGRRSARSGAAVSVMVYDGSLRPVALWLQSSGLWHQVSRTDGA